MQGTRIKPVNKKRALYIFPYWATLTKGFSSAILERKARDISLVIVLYRYFADSTSKLGEDATASQAFANWSL